MSISRILRPITTLTANANRSVTAQDRAREAGLVASIRGMVVMETRIMRFRETPNGMPRRIPHHGENDVFA